jgi:outer membrane lipase/esterase
MVGARLSQCKQGSSASRTQAFSGLWSVMVVGLSLSMVALAQAQTPTDAFRDALFPPGTICPTLNDSDQTGGAEDLRQRCNEIAGADPTSVEGTMALGQVAAEEVATQGTLSVETSTRNIGARLAALRAASIGVSVRRFALHPQEPPPPVTLVASLSQYAAVGSAVPVETANPFPRLGIFANGTYTFGDKDETRSGAANDTIEPGFDFDTFGATAGVDYRFTDSFILGLAFSYQTTDADLDASSGSVDTKSYNLSVYTTYYISAFYMDGIVTYGWNDYDIDRNIRYNIAGRNDDFPVLTPSGETTTVNQTAKGDTDGRQFSFGFGAGYDFSVGGVTFGPLVRLNYIRLDIDGYQEEIDNEDDGFGWVLDVDSQDVESLISVLGGQVSYAISTGFGVLLPQVRFEWQHEFEDDSRTITARFVHDPGDPETNQRTPINYTTDDPDRDFFNVGAGLSATFRGGVAAFVYYETVLGLDDVTAHSFVLGVRKEL